MLKSIVGSRPQTPGTQTPSRQLQTDTEDEEYTFASPLFSAALQQRLQDLSIEGDAAKKDQFIHSIEILEADRRKSAIAGREQALNYILTVLSNKYEPALMSEQLFNTIVNAYMTARSEMEVILSLQLITVALTLVEDDQEGHDECLEKVRSRLIPTLIERAKSKEIDVSSRTSMITCYSVLQFFANVGGGGYGLEEIITSLLDIAEATTAAESLLTAAALQGVGLLLVITSTVTTTLLIPEVCPSLIQLLQLSSPDVKQAAAKVAGVLFEKCHTAMKESEDAQEIVEVLGQLCRESSKRVAKRDKKARKSLIRDLLKTASYSPEDALDNSDNSDSDFHHVLTHFRLNSHRSLKIYSWSVLLVIQHLKWVFGPGLQTQLANNPFAASILRDLANDGKNGDIDFDLDADTLEDEDGSEPRAARRAVNIRKARLEKLAAREEGNIG